MSDNDFGSGIGMKAFVVGLTLGVGMLVIAAAPPAAPGSGADLFAQNCAACHQSEGQGVDGAFPALAGDKFVQGPASEAAAVVLKGRAGMPSFADDLTDQQIAAVLTFVRGAWGNHAGAIPIETIAAVRNGKPVAETSVLPGH